MKRLLMIFLYNIFNLKFRIFYKDYYERRKYMEKKVIDIEVKEVPTAKDETNGLKKVVEFIKRHGKMIAVSVLTFFLGFFLGKKSSTSDSDVYYLEEIDVQDNMTDEE